MVPEHSLLLWCFGVLQLLKCFCPPKLPKATELASCNQKYLAVTWYINMSRTPMSGWTMAQFPLLTIVWNTTKYSEAVCTVHRPLYSFTRSLSCRRHQSLSPLRHANKVGLWWSGLQNMTTHLKTQSSPAVSWLEMSSVSFSIPFVLVPNCSF